MIPCDLCGASDPDRVLQSPRLDGPLVRCRSCGLYYVGEHRSNLAFGSDSSSATTERIREANRDFANLSLDEERRLARLNARTRLDLIRRYRDTGTLIEVGCARGDFLHAAREHFNVIGVEPNEELARDAASVAPVYRGLVENCPQSGFDVAASFHVIEHTDSPHRFVDSMAAKVKPGGLVVIETPNIHSLAFRLMKRQWRQFIPEHYFFFDESTMRKLMEGAGLQVEQIRRIGKYASPAFILNRLSRYFRPLRLLEGTAGRLHLQIPVDPMDIMIAIASKRHSTGRDRNGSNRTL
jgi:2-polyprenyl-3-methyl-5-hydroxy-6-metoxy-1,4-benzoquinol methylase